MRLGFQIDAADILCGVNGAWDEFAIANGAIQLAGEAVLGVSLWDFIAGSEVRQLYRDMFVRLRRDSSRIQFTFRCDSPNTARLLDMRAYARPDGHIFFETHVVREWSLHTPLPLNVAVDSGPETVVLCSVCKDVHIEDEWVALDTAVDTLGLFRAKRSYMLSHGLCPDCFERLSAPL